MNIMLCQLGKPSKAVEVEAGTTIRDLLGKLSIDPSGKSFTVVDEEGPSVEGLDYLLQDGDTLRISANNAAA